MSRDKQYYGKKYFNLKALDVDTSTRSVKVAISQMGTLDRDGDVITKDAFNRTIKLKGPKGTNEIWHLLDHDAKTTSALSKFAELYVEGDYLVGVSKYKDSWAWREVAWPLYESGDLSQHSIGFRTVKADQKDKYNEIQEIELFEGSAVIFAAQPNTPTMEVRKSLSFEETQSEIHSRIERLLKLVKSEELFEDKKSLIEIEFRQIQQQLSDLKMTTQPVEKTLESVKEEDELLDVLKTFNNELKTVNGKRTIITGA